MAATGTSGEVQIVLLPETIIAAKITAEQEGWRALGDRCFTLAKGMCPDSSDSRAARPGNMGSGSSDGTHLVDTLQLRFEYGPDPRIGIGSAKTVGDQDYSLLDIVEAGTDPHPIDPVNAQVLVFQSKGQTVFAAHVDHPGTPKNPFVERAMQRAVQEAGGLALSV